MRITATSWVLFSLFPLGLGIDSGAAEPRQREVVVDVSAAAPGLSVEEVERQVTIPLEVMLAGIRGLDHTRSLSRAGRARVRLGFRREVDPDQVRQEIVKRLQSSALPTGVLPQLSTVTEADQILLYVLRGPRDASGKAVYNSGDLRTFQESVLEKEFLRVPGVAEVRSAGGVVPRFEVHADPDRLRRYGITLEQLRDALARANKSSGGPGREKDERDAKGSERPGSGEDPFGPLLALKDPGTAVARLRAREREWLTALRSVVVVTIKEVPIRVEDVVEGGRLAREEEEQNRGVVVGHAPRTVLIGRSRSGEGEQDDLVQGVVLGRPGQDPQPVLRALRDRVKQLNEFPGHLLPGVRIEPYYERPARAGADEPVLWIRGAFPASISLEEVSGPVRKVRSLLAARPEVAAVVSQVGPEEGVDRVRLLVRIRPEALGKDQRPGQKLAADLEIELSRQTPGGVWDVSSKPADEKSEVLAPGPGEGLLKIFGPDLEVLERLAARAVRELNQQEGMFGVRVAHVLGRVGLEFRVDPEKCKRWKISPTDLQNILQAARGTGPALSVRDGGRSVDVVLRWPGRLRESEAAILDIPVDDPVDASGGAGPVKATPRLLVRDLVSPVAEDGRADPGGSFLRLGPMAIYREEGRRFIGILFRPRGKDPQALFDAARKKLATLVGPPYRAQWEGNLR